MGSSIASRSDRATNVAPRHRIAGPQLSQITHHRAIALGQHAEVQVACVCLEYGKPTPSSADPYRIAKLEDATRKPEVRVLLEAFSSGAFDQKVAQLAAWHFNNGLDREDLIDTGFARSRLDEAEAVVARVRAKCAEGAATASDSAKAIDVQSSSDVQVSPP